MPFKAKSTTSAKGKCHKSIKLTKSLNLAGLLLWAEPAVTAIDITISASAVGRVELSLSRR